MKKFVTIDGKKRLVDVKKAPLKTRTVQLGDGRRTRFKYEVTVSDDGVTISLESKRKVDFPISILLSKKEALELAAKVCQQVAGQV